MSASLVASLIGVGVSIGASVRAEPTRTAAPGAAAPAIVPAGGSTKFGVLGIGPASLSPTFVTQLETAAATGLAASGADVVARAATARPAGACESATCIQEVARTSGARYLLRGTCALDGSTYRIHLELLDGATSRVVAAREDTCEICTETEVAETTNIAASALKTTLAASPRTLANDRAMTAMTAAVAGAPTLRPPLWRRALPWVAFGAAAAAIGVGVYVLSLNDKPTACHDNVCNGFYNTALDGTAWIAGGVVAGLIGALTLGGVSKIPASTSHAEASPAATRRLGVVVSPVGLAAWGTF